jgi:hypothetical protein
LNEVIAHSMKTVRNKRWLRWVLPALAAGLALPVPQAALAQGAGVARGQGWETAGERSFLQREISKRAGKDLNGFYAARDFQPLWLNEFGRPSGAASMLMHHLRTADIDGVDPKAIRFDKLVKTIDKARRGDEGDIAKAEVELSRAFATYVQAMRAAPRDGMIYETRALAPVVPTQEAALQAAADLSGDPARLEDYISAMRWMHPLYAPLRQAMEDPRFSEGRRRQRPAVDVRGWRSRRFDEGRGRQTRSADPADGRLHPPRDRQSLLERA